MSRKPPMRTKITHHQDPDFDIGGILTTGTAEQISRKLDNLKAKYNNKLIFELHDYWDVTDNEMRLTLTGILT